MLTCVFWNTNKRDRRELICQLVSERSVDVLAIAEPRVPATELADAISLSLGTRYQPSDSEPSRLQVICGPRASGVRRRFSEPAGKIVIHSLGSGHDEISLVFAHLMSRRHWSLRSQSAQVKVLADDIRSHEEDVGHRRTVLLGDLNLDPFDTALVDATGLHAMMTRHAVRRGSREVQSRDYPFFYNPMWGFFGDRSDGPPGTCSFPQRGDPISYDWSIFDQVLIRPDLLKRFINVEIVTRIGDVSLAAPSSGRPNKAVGSDHFPIVLQLAD